MNHEKINENRSVVVLNATEVEQVGGAIAPLVAWGLWAAGGTLVGVAAAAVVHYWGNGNHQH